jgi:signal transduction histidine kinase
LKPVANFLQRNYRTLFSVLALIVAFYFSIQQSYLLFHTLVELFSIVVAFAVFIVAWNSRKMQDNPYLRFVGIAYIAIAALDLLHTLTFKGLDMIPSDGQYYANQFWVATRMLEAFTLLAGFGFLGRRKQIAADFIFVIYFVISLLITLSIITYKVFPRCYIDGYGQTAFKIYAEYFIILILLLVGVMLYRYRQHFSKPVYQLLMVSLVFTIISEFCFTLYVSNYSTANQIGHYAKLISFFLIYKANVETGFLNPTGAIFKGLKENEERYRIMAQNVPELRDINAMKDKLFSIIAHDLKNPFTSMLSFSEMIARNAGSMDRDKISKMAQRINQSSKQAYNLLENLLDWSRMQSGLLTPNVKQVPLSVLFKNARDFASPIALNKNITLIVNDTGALTVRADQQMIDTVLRNLISNALKFTHPEGAITLSVKQSETEATIMVADTGVGIKPEAQQELLSIRSQYTTAGTHKEKGTGLGLILCMDFVQLNGGRIWLESTPGQGTVFYFTLMLG